MPSNATVSEAIQTGRILIIDDDPVIVDVIKHMLEEEGHQVDSAHTGQNGLELFKRSPYDVVLTDLRLGEMSGIEVLRQLKEINPHTAVIILTGFASTETAVEAVRLGANDYLTKPVRLLDLIKSVRTQLSAVHLSNKVESLNQAIALERDKLRRTVAELALLKRLAERMMSVLNYVEGFEVILNLLVEEVDADIAVIYDLERGSARYAAPLRPTEEEIKQLTEIITSGTSSLADLSVNSTSIKFESIDETEPFKGTGNIASAIAVPLKQGERIYGILVAASRNNARYEAVWSDFIARLSQNASEFLTKIKQSVERQRHFTGAVVEHTLDGIVVADLFSNEVMLNPVVYTMLGLASGSLVSLEQVSEKLDLDFNEVWNELVEGKASIESNPSVKSHQIEISRDNQKFFYTLNFSLLPDDSGGLGKMMIVIHDMTHERSVEEMKSRLISNITHEVRTPTGVIKEFASLILDGVAGELSENLRQYVEIMHSNIERLSRLIDNLLTLARADTGGFSIVLQPISVEPLIETVVASMAVKLKRKGISLSTDIPGGLPYIYADRDAVTQILTNLIENAYKYSDENTRIQISASEKGGGRIELMVKDQGYGIEEENMEAIFTRFHRLVDTDDPRFQEGVGLGLSLVKDLVSRHGGEIWVESKVGEGSTFHFTLQVAAEDDEHRPA